MKGNWDMFIMASFMLIRCSAIYLPRLWWKFRDTRPLRFQLFNISAQQPKVILLLDHQVLQPARNEVRLLD